MSKAHETKNLPRCRTSRPLLAISFAASLAAFGCTTNRNLGNGTPTRSGPDVRTAPTSGVTSGSERETPVVPPPMTSASLAPAPDVGQQPARGRYLGVVNPGPAGRAYVSDARMTGQLIPPSLTVAEPQATIDPSISSDGAAVVNSTDALATAATTTATTATGATPLPAGTFASGATLPTVAASGIPTVTEIAPVATLPTVATSATPTVTAATAGVQIVRGTNGAATITNATTATTNGNQ